MSVIPKEDKRKLMIVSTLFGSLGLTMYVTAYDKLRRGEVETIDDIDWYKECKCLTSSI